MFDLMWNKNQHGGGAAWRETQADGSKVVCWEKGLMGDPGKERLRELAETLPIPYILHMRIATIGGVKPNMTHPFPIDKKSPNTLKGKTKGYVLFHNGTFKEWEKDGRALAITSGTPIPGGKWSDSRALAWMCSIIGNGLMEFHQDQKGLAFGPEREDIFLGSAGWEQVLDPDTNEKIWCSNDHFIPLTGKGSTNYNANRTTYEIKPYCDGVRSCLSTDLDKDGRCKDHPKAAQLPIISVPGSTSLVRVSPAVGVSSTPIPFPPTPKDDFNPEGPLLGVAQAAKALYQRRIDRSFLKSVQRAHERMSKGGKDGDRAKRQLIVAAAMPCFNGLLG